MAAADFDRAVLRWQQVLLERESKLRLFQQLHQEPEYPTEWRRASGRQRCLLCGLKYSDHPVESIFNLDPRLCDGTIVHL